MSAKKVNSQSNIENEQDVLSIIKKIDIQQQKSVSFDQKIVSLEEKYKALLLENEQKKLKLAQVQNNINKCKILQNPIIKQLRQHFKALKQELGSSIYDEEQEDDIDVDEMTYEQLLQLGEKIGKVSKGLSTQIVEKLDKFKYQNDLGIQEDCTICREEYAQQIDCIRLNCKHFFHSECLVEWLKLQKVCPNCKAEIN